MQTASLKEMWKNESSNSVGILIIYYINNNSCLYFNEIHAINLTKSTYLVPEYLVYKVPSPCEYSLGEIGEI